MSGTAAYPGVRPYEWVTADSPSGEVERLLQFALGATNNQNFTNETGELGIYAI